MNDQKPGGKARPSNRRGRGCLLWLGAGLALLIGLMLIGSLYESKAEAADALAYPPPGRMVDIGGYRLHIHCTGTGNPTVVIEAGWGDFSPSWTGVQQEVAKTTQVCTYDRAGSGWSDPGPLPRNTLQYAKELHRLLHNANIPGPYVLAGHSLGGITVRVFTDMYLSEVAGVVLLDSMVPGQFTHPPEETTSLAGSPSQSFALIPSLARIGVVRLFSGAFGLAPAELPAQEAKAYQSRVVRPASLQAYMDEGRGVPASGVQEKAVKTIGDIPLIVLTARLNSTYPDWQAWQAEQLQLSTNSQQMFAEKSGHNIQYDQPDAAVAAIVKMVELIRQAVKK